VCAQAHQAVVASAVDADALGAPPNLAVVPNGVDAARFPFGRGPRDKGRVVFTGNLGYFANADAVIWFATRVLPLVRRSLPAVRFEVVGARPPRRLRRLARRDGAVHLVGRWPTWASEAARPRGGAAPGGRRAVNKTLRRCPRGRPGGDPSCRRGSRARHGESPVAASAEASRAAH
jgi:hypothetical protein